MNNSEEQDPNQELTLDPDPQGQDLQDALRDFQENLAVFSVLFAPDPLEYEYS